MKVSEYMSTDVVTANLRDGLRQTFYRMRERDIRHMPVIGDDERVVGIISDRDLRHPDWVDDEENCAHYYLLDNAHKVERTMSGNPVTVSPDENLQKAVEVILDHKYGALPVVDNDQKLVGMISAMDLLRAFHDIDDS
ncbi:MAG: CBS domain-containing protein [Myxococcota bacterium]|jgi:acetoin utilization protein AcuB|nr:CBS domain-containing protein [Myxococcota bacterium]